MSVKREIETGVKKRRTLFLQAFCSVRVRIKTTLLFPLSLSRFLPLSLSLSFPLFSHFLPFLPFSFCSFHPSLLQFFPHPTLSLSLFFFLFLSLPPPLSFSLSLFSVSLLFEFYPSIDCSMRREDIKTGWSIRRTRKK